MNDQQATDVRIRFPAGEGLSIGDPVRYLGIDVGEVTDVQINDDLTSVIVAIRLVGQAERLARSGTQFWVERPRLDVSEVRGLETLVGGRYIAVEPTRSDSPASQDFVGLPKRLPCRVDLDPWNWNSRREADWDWCAQHRLHIGESKSDESLMLDLQAIVRVLSYM